MATTTTTAAASMLNHRHHSQSQSHAEAEAASSDTDSSSSQSHDNVSDDEVLATNATAAATTVAAAPRTTLQKKDWRPKSTFHLKPRSEMNLAEKICMLALVPDSLHGSKAKGADDSIPPMPTELKEATLDRGPLPTHPMWRENVFVLTRASIPFVLQAISYAAFPNAKWSIGFAYVVYFFSFLAFALFTMGRMNSYALHYGTFDEKRIGRDRTPDQSTTALARGVTIYMFLRTGGCFFLHYTSDTSPLQGFAWSFLLRLPLWQLVMDGLFYIYHRACHEVPALWHIHQLHHSTKHPTPILAILAGDYQEVIEIVAVPLLACLIVPMSFHELFLTLCYTIYVEMLGHSGIRARWTHPILWILGPKVTLTIADHELHHERGKSGKNYGKQSRLWDQLFGTIDDKVHEGFL